MTIPRELALKTFPEGIRLAQNPVQTVTRLRGKPATEIKTRSFEIRAAMDVERDGEAGWKLMAKDGSYTAIGYDSVKQELFVDRTHSGLTKFSEHFPARTSAPLSRRKTLSFDILVDRNSIEVFVDDGRVAITNLIFSEAAPVAFTFYSDGGTTAQPATFWPLKSIWTGK